MGENASCTAAVNPSTAASAACPSCHPPFITEQSLSDQWNARRNSGLSRTCIVSNRTTSYCPASAIAPQSKTAWSGGEVQGCSLFRSGLIAASTDQLQPDTDWIVVNIRHRRSLQRVGAELASLHFGNFWRHGQLLSTPKGVHMKGHRCRTNPCTVKVKDVCLLK